MCDQLAVMYAGRVVEKGPVSRIFNAPAHPYSKALLGSIPRMTDNRRQLTAIDGQPPDLSVAAGRLLVRARAAPRRSPAAAPRRRPNSRVDDGRTARCWLAAPGVGAASTSAALAQAQAAK
jgi:oligopeptide/dipeptide ABC transporter ATP-binding protein